jgi:hypothetical protein
MKMTLILFSILFIGLTVSLFAKKVEINDAKQVGKNFYYERININDRIPYSSLEIVQEFTENAGNEPLWYIFNFRDKGFIIVAADDAVNPVLGYSFESSYSTENPSPEFMYWMNNYKDQIVYVKQTNLQPDDQISATWQRLSSTNVNELMDMSGSRDVEPLITSMWNQDFPNNAMCPEDPASGGSYNGRVPVGCVATAMSQIMHYWRYPITGTGYHCDTWHNYGTLCADFGNTTYEWDGMSNAPTKESDPVAVLSYHCGIAVDMNYGPNGSGAYTSKVPSALKAYFNYATSCIYKVKNNFTYDDWIDLMKGDLD